MTNVITTTCLLENAAHEARQAETAWRDNASASAVLQYVIRSKQALIEAEANLRAHMGD